jgi:hypothetical protein
MSAFAHLEPIIMLQMRRSDRRFFNLTPIFKLQTSASEMTRVARSAGGGPCPH